MRTMHGPVGLTIQILLLCVGLGLWFPDCAVSSTWAQVSSDSQLFEMNFSKGLLRFNQGLYQEAERSFADALRQKPDDTEVRYYLGQAYLRSSRPADAERIFRTLLVNEPGSGRAQLGLGIVQYQQDAYREALASLATAEQALPEDPLVHFYQGLTYGKLGQYDQVHPRLIKTMRLSPDLAPEAHYQSGLAYVQQGLFDHAKQEFTAVVQAEFQSTLSSDAHYQSGLAYLQQSLFDEAKREFNAVVQPDPQSELARSATEFLQQLTQPRPTSTGKRWDLNLSVTQQYDSNVVLLPGGIQPPGGSTGISQKEDHRTALYGRGELRPIDNETWTVGTAYGLYQSFHRTLSAFDVQNHTPSLYVQHKVGPLTSRLAYAFDYIDVGRSPYLVAHAIQPTFTVMESDRLYTQVQLRHQHKDFQHGRFLFNSTRDGKNWLAGVTQYVLFADKQAHVRLGYTYDKDVTGGGRPATATPGDTTNADWAYEGHRIATGIGLPPFRQFRTDLAFDYYQQDYLNPNSFSTSGATVRRDKNYLFNATVSRELGAGLSIIGQYSYTRDQTNVFAFDYARNVVSLTLAGQF
ncbi:MAG: tetratricopeptide repeat protein [Nitrospira sp.]|nr:MAG: tetratricopeptide repeat protein [Nitrospira sp.]